MKYLHVLLCVLSINCFTSLLQAELAEVDSVQASNPVIWADVPDTSVIRVGDTYYMSSTTMHMSPGLPIMKSKDLVNWDLVCYVYDTLVDNDALNLENGKNAYGAGSWASSLQFHKGIYYVSTFSSTSGKTHVYTTDDIENGEWAESSFSPSLHDSSLFFDDDGRVYMIYGSNDLHLIELTADASKLKPGGVDKLIIANASQVAGDDIMLGAEGSQLRKIKGRYYLMTITWPINGMRTVLIHRADKIDGPYEGRVALQDKGVAQGGLINTPDGDWYAFLFQDHGAVGRVPYVVPVEWQDGWPVFGVEGKTPMAVDIAVENDDLQGIVGSDEFSRTEGDLDFSLSWQWNHNPDNKHWSLVERAGYLRLRNGRVDTDVLQSRNILTQRTFGPTSSARTAMDVSGMKEGDIAGLIALQKNYGFVGVKAESNLKTIVMVRVEGEAPIELAKIPLEQEIVHLKVDCDFRKKTDKAYFYYSLDGVNWSQIGDPLQMKYTLPHFMGYRYGLFNYGTESIGGVVDFDFYRISGEIATREDESASVLKNKVQPFSLDEVRLLDGPFKNAVRINREYLLAHDPDRLLFPFLREAGLEPKGESYGNWEGSGLDGHTGGHYLTALASMIASGADTPEGELQSRLDYMINELERCQKATGNGYIGGVPGSQEMWRDVAAGTIDANGFGLNGKWVPWYNLHKLFAGLRDVWLWNGNEKARDLLLGLSDWCYELTIDLSHEQMQEMLRAEHGGMNEVLADVYSISGDNKYLALAKRFNHDAVLNPLMAHEDRLTGMHANTQIPKVIGLERIASLSKDEHAHSGAQYFWNNVVNHRSLSFGGNSVSEHFNDIADFGDVIESREGPETCNTYNMLKLTSMLFAVEPDAAYSDFYERALYNHILSSIHPETPGYVYFTPIRPELYRVYSQPEQAFWCCVGSGMENPGTYGSFIYSKSSDGLYVNLFIASELNVSELGLKLGQSTTFPDEARTQLSLKLEEPREFTLNLRHPGWVEAGSFAVKVNGELMKTESAPSSYVPLRRVWHDGDVVEVELPMETTVERLPDGSDWVSILRGPIVLAHPAGVDDVVGIRADDSRMAHVAPGSLVSLEKVPVIVAEFESIAQNIKTDPSGAAMAFRLMDVVEPEFDDGLELIPFFRLHDQRYQMYWQVATEETLEERREQFAEKEKVRTQLEKETLDSVAIGEQQPEVEHGFKGEETESGPYDNLRWRHGKMLQYTLNTQGESSVDLLVKYNGSDNNRHFDIFINDRLLVTEDHMNPMPGKLFNKRYPLPDDVLKQAKDNKLTIRFVAKPGSLAGGIFDLRLMRREG